MIASPDWITEEKALRTTNQDPAGATPCPSSGASALRINGRRPSKPGPNTTLVAGPQACTWQPASTPSQRYAMRADRSQSALRDYAKNNGKSVGSCQEL